MSGSDQVSHLAAIRERDAVWWREYERTRVFNPAPHTPNCVCALCDRRRLLALVDAYRVTCIACTARDAGGGHPWQAFLDARMAAIAWLTDVEGYSDEAILHTMNMDPTQLVLLKMTIADQRAKEPR